jgi:hypothetical protein
MSGACDMFTTACSLAAAPGEGDNGFSALKVTHVRQAPIHRLSVEFELPATLFPCSIQTAKTERLRLTLHGKSPAAKKLVAQYRMSFFSSC